MILQLNLIRRIARFFRRKDTEQPYHEQPLTQYDAVETERESILMAQVDARYERLGMLPIREMKNVNVVQEYMGTNPEVIKVPSNKQVVIDAVIVGPTGDIHEVTVSLKTGEKWTPNRQRRALAAKLKEENPNIENGSQYLIDGEMKANYWLREYVPKEQAIL